MGSLFSSDDGQSDSAQIAAAKPAPQPAKRPERVVEVDAEDIELGSEGDEGSTDLRKQGKRSLIKPSGSKPTTGVNV